MPHETADHSRRLPKLAPQTRLVIVFGDQLDLESALVRSIRPEDTVLMMEVAGESRHVPSHVQRTALFLSAMRHFAAELTRRKIRVRYIALDDPANTGAFETEITRAMVELKPAQIACTVPGEWRVLAMLERIRDATGIALTVMPDEHFLTTPEEFAAWADGRSSLTMEFFYREQRRKTGYLMEGGSAGKGKTAKPIGGVWNFDKENRLPFGKTGPDPRPAVCSARCDACFPICQVTPSRSRGPSRARRLSRRSTTSLRIGLRHSGRSRTRCGRASRRSTTRRFRAR